MKKVTTLSKKVFSKKKPKEPKKKKEQEEKTEEGGETETSKDGYEDVINLDDEEFDIPETEQQKKDTENEEL